MQHMQQLPLESSAGHAIQSCVKRPQPFQDARRNSRNHVHLPERCCAHIDEPSPLHSTRRDLMTVQAMTVAFALANSSAAQAIG